MYFAMITNNDIKKLQKVFTTKEDLARFSTKDDLKDFARKDDLKGFATKKDFNVFATKKDLVKFVTKDHLGLVVQDIVDLLKEVRIELKGDILNFKDEILGEIVKLREDVTVTTGYRDIIENHENRLIKLEENAVSR